MKTWTLHTANDQAFNQNTLINGRKITDPITLCKFIKAHWCELNKVKSFSQWATELNEDENFSGGFTKEDALDNLSSNYVLNIDNEYVDLYKFFNLHQPFKVEVNLK
ncbi:MAG: hypothetical protein PHT07_21685 [Paludibacter sp.]|nr:hypothetical protein [Paludibacter sp.]